MYPEVPEVVIKPGKMLHLSSSKMKALIVVLILSSYVYLLVFIKTLHLKTQRLDHILSVALETEREIMNVHTIDRKLARQIADLHRLHNVY